MSRSAIKPTASAWTPLPEIDPRLACEGGTPVFAEGPPGWPGADAEVRAALEEAYASGNWGRYHGPYCRRLAAALGQYHGIEHVLLCSSGTVAVELALRGLKIAAGDEVLVAGYDFPGNFRAIEAVGATPVLVDIDPANGGIDAGHLAAAIGPRTRAVIASHLHGGLAAMRELTALAAQRGLAVVEDACQAAGALVAGRRAGGWGDVAVLSFGGSKLLTAGRGGAVLTGDAAIGQRIRIFCDRGNDAFPLSELQAAVLLPQLARLDEHNARRAAAAGRLLDRLGEARLAGLRTWASAGSDSTAGYYKLGFWYEPAAWQDRQREEFVAAVQAEGVALDSGFRGFVRRGPRRCRRGSDLTQAARAAGQTVLLHHPILLECDAAVDRLAAALIKIARAWQDGRGDGPECVANPIAR